MFWITRTLFDCSKKQGWNIYDNFVLFSFFRRIEHDSTNSKHVLFSLFAYENRFHKQNVLFFTTPRITAISDFFSEKSYWKLFESLARCRGKPSLCSWCLWSYFRYYASGGRWIMVVQIHSIHWRFSFDQNYKNVWGKFLHL